MRDSSQKAGAPKVFIKTLWGKEKPLGKMKFFSIAKKRIKKAGFDAIPGEPPVAMQKTPQSWSFLFDS